MRQLITALGTEEHRVRDDGWADRAPRSTRRFATLRIGIAALVIVGGYVHFCLYRHGYRTIPKIGVGFLAQFVTSALVATALLLGPHRIAQLGGVKDNIAGWLTGLAAAGLSAGTLVAFALTRRPGGLFNFEERGLEPAPQALIALLAEVGVLVLLAVWVLAAHSRQTHLRAVRVAGV